MIFVSIRKIFLLSLMAIFSFMVKAEAYEVQIYDGDAETIIRNINKYCSEKKGFNTWGKEYYTYQGVKRCEAHFGSNNNNLIRFRLNNDGSVSRILITTPYVFEETTKGGDVLAICLATLGLNQSEAVILINNFLNDALSSDTEYLHKKYQVWCSATQRQVVLDVETNFSTKMDLYLYAYK